MYLSLSLYIYIYIYKSLLLLLLLLIVVLSLLSLLSTPEWGSTFVPAPTAPELDPTWAAPAPSGRTLSSRLPVCLSVHIKLYTYDYKLTAVKT